MTASKSNLEICRVRLRGTNQYSFRQGEWADVIGAYFVTPKNQEPRLAYAVMYHDGAVDYVAVSDTKNYDLSLVKA